MGGAVILSAEKLVAFELCPRRYQWANTYAALRISPLRALYIALDAGLTTDKDAEKASENAFLSLAAKPGLDILGGDTYSIAMHLAKLAGILAAALRSAYTTPWKLVEPITLPSGHTWHSGVYDAGDGHLRRVALVDRWSDDRKQQEITGWRTIGETVALEQTVVVTALSIGSSHDKRRHSAWTRCYRHPRNHTFRLQRKTSEEDFSQSWQRVWREDSGIPTQKWLTQMREDGCMEDLVHTVKVPPPARRGDYLAEMERIGGQMDALGETPEMRLAGCYGFAPCPFICVCHGLKQPSPEQYGFVRISPK